MPAPPPPKAITRRRFLKGGAALSVTGLSGCVTTGNSVVDGFVRSTFNELGSSVASEAIFAVLGVPNRMKFASGRPMTEQDTRDASQAQSLIRNAGLTVQELPRSLREFNPTPTQFAAGKVTASSLPTDAWQGPNSPQGKEQLERVQAVLSKYALRKDKPLSLAEAVEFAQALQPFLVAKAHLERMKTTKPATRQANLIIPARSFAIVPARLGCLGAGLPLPRAGEGSRLVNVPEAVHPSQRAAVTGLLTYGARSDTDIYTVQYLIWNLIHADNSGYRRIFERDISGKYARLLDTAVPGGWRHYRDLVREAHARREAEARKLALAKLALDQLNTIFGMSFELKAPSGAAFGTPAFAKDLLQQGFNQGLRDIEGQVSGTASRGLSAALNSLLGNTGLPLAQRAGASAQEALLPQALENTSRFNRLQGYSLLKPGVGAHIEDIGGAAAHAKLTIVNSSNEDFGLQTGMLTCCTPERTQMQQLVPMIRSSDLARATPVPGLPRIAVSSERIIYGSKAQSILDDVLSAASELGKVLSVEIADKRLLKGLGTVLGVFDVVSYLWRQVGIGNGKDAWGNDISSRDFIFTAIGLLPHPFAKAISLSYSFSKVATTGGAALYSAVLGPGGGANSGQNPIGRDVLKLQPSLVAQTWDSMAPAFDDYIRDTTQKSVNTLKELKQSAAQTANYFADMGDQDVSSFFDRVSQEF